MKKTKRIKIIIILIIAFLTVIPFGIGVIGYTVFTGVRMETPENIMPDLNDFPGLSRRNYTLTSDKGMQLAGYLYTGDDSDHKSVVVFSHGLGLGGHIPHIDVIDVLARGGFDVFAYDATGCDGSEGKGIYSFTQGLKDLDTVISFVEAEEEFVDRDILLFGHSWGAFNVMAVGKYHPEVKGIVALSGYEDPMAPMSYANPGGRILSPYVAFYNRLLYGSAAGIKASDGLDATEAPVFIAHGVGDSLIPTSAGYDILYEKYNGNSRFTFRLLENRKHLSIYSDDAVAAYRDQLENGMDLSKIELAERDKMYGADSELMREIIDFYNQCL